ncbi:TOBE domain-containing protein [Neorhizobium galegae]|uniref:TOBE domain-containing protein n=1 Tax=Neorhizobium galegae TaxID=399 RepID=UPI0009BADCF5
MFVAEGGIPARVAIVEPTGSGTQVVTVRAQDQNLTILLRERAALLPGDTINLAVSTADVHLFDAATGGRTEG